MSTSTWTTLVSSLQRARHVVVLTGAGASRESGIPTFRDAMEGYWARFDPGELATPEAFEKNPELVSRWYDERRCAVLECEPNAGHVALAQIQRALQARGDRLTLITQNVDTLHQRAGSTGVIELHGTLSTWRCTRTGESYSELPVPFEHYPPESAAGGLLRPGVVWFGEALPEEALQAASAASEACDLYLAIGTSGAVWPAAGLVLNARRAGALCLEINPTPTEMSEHFDGGVREGAASALSALYEAAFGERSGA